MHPPLEGFSTKDQLMQTKITSRVLVFASELSSLRLSAEVRSVGVFKCFTLNSLEENSSNGGPNGSQILNISYGNSTSCYF